MKQMNIKDLNNANIVLITKEDAPKEINEQFASIMKEQGFSYSGMAEILGVSRQVMDRYLCNPKQMPIIIALRIAKVLNKPVEELFDLGEYGWLKKMTLEKGSNAYVRIDNGDIYSKNEYITFIETTNQEYYCKEESAYISKKEWMKLAKKDPKSAEKYKYLFAEIAINNKPIFLDE